MWEAGKRVPEIATGLANRVMGALSAQPATQTAAGAIGGGVTEATDDPWLGLGAAFATPTGAATARRLVSPVPMRLTPEQERLAGVLRREGVQLRPGQATGSKALQNIEGVLDNLPFSGGQGQAIKREQQAAFNRAVLNRAGIADDVATPPVLTAATNTLKQEFERISNATTLTLDANFNMELRNLVNSYARKLPSQTREVFHNYVDDITQLGGRMDGATYQQTRSDLGKQSKAIVNSDPTLSQALKGLQQALDRAMERSVPKALRDDWNDARSQWAALKIINNTVKNASAGSAAGDISPAQLWNAVRQGTTTDAFARGAGGDLNDLARAGQMFLKEQIPNSGTAQRSMWQNLLQGGLPTGAATGAGFASGGEPLSMMAGAAAGFGIPPAVAAFMNSPIGRAYLLNQLATGVGPRATPGLLSAIGAAQMPEMFAP
jgi:hypothetical protein